VATTTPRPQAAAIPGIRAPTESAVVRDFEPGTGEEAGAARPGPHGEGWIGVDVPGDVHTALVEAGRIENPFYDRNEDACAWMEEREWWYRIAFAGPEAPAADERLRLVLHGVDTFATVFLNGHELGRHENMFREVAFDVTGRVLPSAGNLLAIRFDPPLRHAGPRDPEQWSSTPAERVWMRKAQYGFGWDWGPRLPTIGLWRPVELRTERQATLTRVNFATLAIGRTALVEVDVEAERFAGDGDLEASIELRSPGGGEPARATVTLRDGRATAFLSLTDPPLWWTHDLGEPALHDLRVGLLADGDEVDVRERQVGVRTLELDQRPDPEEPGTRFFRFVLNGVGIFARGANWIPADSFVGAVGADRYERLIGDARDAHMNMLRVWGGGIYEHDLFYDLCDRVGLLVWQDFMFSCATYPEAPLALEVELEARAQVTRLAGHPSLALWCGNNENQWIHDMKFPDRGGERVPGSLFYDDILPRAVEALDPHTPYWPGSPFGGDDHNSRQEGDAHNWEVWHGQSRRRFGDPVDNAPTPESVSFRRYAEDEGRFISEFGVLAAPDRETLRRWIPADQLEHHSPAMDHHTKDTPKNKIDMLLESVTGVAGDLDEFVDFSMIAQAEALKFGIEHFRRRAPHCSGALVWQLNDCWPVLSWALLDYHGFGKAGYYAVRRAFAPVLASFKVGDAVELWVTNDTGAPVRDTARVRLTRFAGEVIEEEDVEFEVDAHTSRCVHRWDAGALPGAPDRYLSVRSATSPPNRHFFAAIKDLEREPARLEHVFEAVNGGRDLAVRLRADAYAYFVHLAHPDERVRFSDNYLELEPGEERTVVLTHPETAPRPQDVSVRAR
jgi:beta-mannosidase